MAVAAGLMSLFTAAWPVGAIAAVVILLGATASGWNGVFLAEIIRDVRPAEVGLATSGSPMFTYLGIVLGPSLFGALASAVGFPKAYIVMGAAVLLGGILGAFRRAGPSDNARARPRFARLISLNPAREGTKWCRLSSATRSCENSFTPEARTIRGLTRCPLNSAAKAFAMATTFPKLIYSRKISASVAREVISLRI
jgi:MFS family permease